MNIGIICATKDEIQPFLSGKAFRKLKNEIINVYKVTQGENTILVCESGIGKINATLATTQMIQQYQCTQIIFSGVGGALAKNLKKGEISIAENIYQHDFDISAFGYNHGETPNNTPIDTNNNLKQAMISFAKKKNLTLKNLNYATGDQFIHNAERKNWIHKTFDAEIIDMESYAIGIVCNKFNIDFTIIRSISDEANDIAQNVFKKSVKSSSRKSADFILSFLKQKIVYFHLKI